MLVTQGNMNHYFFGFGRSLYEYNNGNVSSIFRETDKIVWLYEDIDSALWVGKMSEGVRYYPNIRKGNYSYVKFLEGLTVSSVINDSQGNYCLTTTKEGVFMFN